MVNTVWFWKIHDSEYKDSDQQQTISVEVANVQVDTLKQKMYDIKTSFPKEFDWRLVEIPLILALILGIGVLVYWFVKKQQKKNWRRGLQNTNRKQPAYWIP
jgi:hypothetical protein